MSNEDFQIVQLDFQNKSKEDILAMLQDHLVENRPHYNLPVDVLQIGDDTWSIQAGKFMCSIPRSHMGEYTHVELGSNPFNCPKIEKYLKNTVYPYVPLDLVVDCLYNFSLNQI